MRAAHFAWIVTVNELLPGLLSVPWNVAAPVVAIVPAFGTVTFTVTTIVWPTGKLLTLHVTVPPSDPGAGPVHDPIFAEAELNTNVDGRVFANTTSLATWFCRS
jgi:hypothetical protein